MKTKAYREDWSNFGIEEMKATGIGQDTQKEKSLGIVHIIGISNSMVHFSNFDS
jgi:hypothetical protein